MVRCQNCHVRWQTRWHDGGGVIGLSRHEQEITVIITVAPHIDNLTKHPYRTKTSTFNFNFSFHKKFKMGFSVNVIYHLFLTTILEVNQKTSCTSYSTIKKYWVYSQFLMKRCKLVGSHVSGRGWRFSSGEAIYSLSLARQGRPARLHHHRLQIHKYTNTKTQIQKYKYTQGTFPFAWQGRPLGLHHHRLQTYIICIVLQAVRVCGVCGIHNTHIIPQIRLAELKSCNSTRAPNQAYKRCNTIALQYYCNSIAIAILLQ